MPNRTPYLCPPCPSFYPTSSLPLNPSLHHRDPYHLHGPDHAQLDAISTCTSACTVQHFISQRSASRPPIITLKLVGASTAHGDSFALLCSSFFCPSLPIVSASPLFLGAIVKPRTRYSTRNLPLWSSASRICHGDRPWFIVFLSASVGLALFLLRLHIFAGLRPARRLRTAHCISLQTACTGTITIGQPLQSTVLGPKALQSEQDIARHCQTPARGISLPQSLPHCACRSHSLAS